MRLFNNINCKHLISSVLFLSVVFACSRNTHLRTDRCISAGHVEPVTIAGSSIHIIGQTSGGLQLISAGNYLITTTQNRDSLFYIIGTDSNAVCASFGSKGQGQNDFSSLYTNKQSWKDSLGNTYLVITDTKEIYSINLTKATQSGYPVKEVLSKLNTSGEYNTLFEEALVIAPDDFLIWLGPKYKDARDGLLLPPAFFRHKSNQDHDYNVFPALFRNPRYDGVNYFVHDGPLRIRQDKKKAVFAFAVLNDLIIFDLESNGTKRIMGQSPLSFEELGRTSYENIISTCRLFSIDAAVTDDLIAVLYDGRKIIDTQKEIGSSSYTKIFDWEGNTLAELHFDKYYTQISLNENNQELYLLDTEDNICRLDLQPYITTSSD